MEFVDRVDEIARLKKAFTRKEPGFFVLYGRRRLGKSTLLNRVLKDNDIYFMADKSDQTQQRALLAKTIALHIPDFDRVPYPDWETLFVELNHRTKDHFVLCLDEFPYLVKSCLELPSILQKLLDTKKLKYHLVICGSSQHLMQGMTLNSSAPLYGRAKQIIKLQPIHIHYLQQILSDASPVEIVDNYAVLGGVPRYWELRLDEDSLKEMIMNQIANAIGVLHDEPERLLADDLEKTTLSASILSLIGNGVNRLAEIASRLSRKSTDLGNPISKLIQLGYVGREVPFGENPKNSKKSLYKLNDPFLNFYYRFVVQQQSLIGQGRSEMVWKYISDNFTDFVAAEWEKLCRHAVTGNNLFGIDWNVASRWWGNVTKDKQIELDVVAESMDKKSLLIGECKWTKKENAESLLADLKERTKDFAPTKNHQVYYVLFLKQRPNDGKKDYVLLPEDIINDLK